MPQTLAELKIELIGLGSTMAADVIRWRAALETGNWTEIRNVSNAITQNSERSSYLAAKIIAAQGVGTHGG